MTTQPNHHITSRLLHVTSRIEEFYPWCDPAFDNGMEELEREFAELRMQLT